VSQCRSCNAEVKWVVMKTAQGLGGKNPLDAVPVPDGNIVIEEGHGRILKKDEVTTQDKYKSHFATCLDAAKHRKPK